MAIPFSGNQRARSDQVSTHDPDGHFTFMPCREQHPATGSTNSSVTSLPRMQACARPWSCLSSPATRGLSACPVRRPESCSSSGRGRGLKNTGRTSTHFSRQLRLGVCRRWCCGPSHSTPKQHWRRASLLPMYWTTCTQLHSKKPINIRLSFQMSRRGGLSHSTVAFRCTCHVSPTKRFSKGASRMEQSWFVSRLGCTFVRSDIRKGQPSHVRCTRPARNDSGRPSRRWRMATGEVHPRVAARGSARTLQQRPDSQHSGAGDTIEASHPASSVALGYINVGLRPGPMQEAQLDDHE